MRPSKFIILISSLILALGIFSFTYAQDASAPGDASPPATEASTEEQAQTPKARDTASVCATQVSDFIFKKEKELSEFLDTHFRSSKPTSGLIPAAIERFRQYRDDVREFAEGFVPEGGRLAGGAVAESGECNAAISKNFALVKEMIRSRVLENAHAKKSTRLLDKYKSINSKLDKLNFTIGQMYGYFGALGEKLPCYATQCVRSGK